MNIIYCQLLTGWRSENEMQSRNTSLRTRPLLSPPPREEHRMKAALSLTLRLCRSSAVTAPAPHGPLPQRRPSQMVPRGLPTLCSSPSTAPTRLCTAGSALQAPLHAGAHGCSSPGPPPHRGPLPTGCSSGPGRSCGGIRGLRGDGPLLPWASPGPQGAAAVCPELLLHRPRCPRGRSLASLTLLSQLLLHSGSSLPSICSRTAHPASLTAQLWQRRSVWSSWSWLCSHMGSAGLCSEPARAVPCYRNVTT